MAFSALRLIPYDLSPSLMETLPGPGTYSLRYGDIATMQQSSCHQAVYERADRLRDAYMEPEDPARQAELHRDDAIKKSIPTLPTTWLAQFKVIQRKNQSSTKIRQRRQNRAPTPVSNSAASSQQTP